MLQYIVINDPECYLFKHLENHKTFLKAHIFVKFYGFSTIKYIYHIVNNYSQ